MDSDSETFAFCKKQVREAVSALLEPAQAAGVVRADLEPSDLLRLLHGVGAAAAHTDAAGLDRLLSVVVEGTRARTTS
jgi:hypothetical protein